MCTNRIETRKIRNYGYICWSVNGFRVKPTNSNVFSERTFSKTKYRNAVVEYATVTRKPITFVRGHVVGIRSKG